MGRSACCMAGTASLPLRTVVDTRVIEVPREIFLLALVSDPRDVGHHHHRVCCSTAPATRRAPQRPVCDGEKADRNVRRVAEFASRNRLPYTSVLLDSPEAEASAKSCAIDAEPRQLFSAAKYRSRMRRRIDSAAPRLIIDFSGDEQFDVLIVGGGPAGVAAERRLCWRRRFVRVARRGHCFGGPSGDVEPIENYMGFPTASRARTLGAGRCRP